MSWVVHKFGGASIRDASGVENLGRILRDRRLGADRGRKQAVVVSAMGKTTNALEEVWQALPQAGAAAVLVDAVVDAHERVAEALGLPASILKQSKVAFEALAIELSGQPATDATYDAVVGFGERWSTEIVAEHLAQIGLDGLWVSAWDLVRTNEHHRAAEVDLGLTMHAIQQASEVWNSSVPVMQGFVGSTLEGVSTTLGREGSDFSGALMAEALGAAVFCVWKDVPGVMTGDPRKWPDATFIPHLDHKTAEAMGLAGAGVLHPNTMAPLRRSGIPLLVNGFMDPETTGTRIEGDVPPKDLPPLWTLSTGPEGQTVVRCIGATRETAAAVWQAQFPERPIASLEIDAVVPRCIRVNLEN